MTAIFRAACFLIILVLGVRAIDGAVTPRASRYQASPSVFEWLSGAEKAIGGDTRLSELAAVETSGVSVWYHREQSERPEGPWLTSFTDFIDVRSFGADAVRRTARMRGFSTNDWVDSTEWTATSTILVTAGVSVLRTSDGFAPTGTPPDLALLPVGLAPERVVSTARQASDLHAEPDEAVDGYPHHVVAFSFAGARVRLILNVPSLLPKAVEVHRVHPFNMFLAPWGDVTQRVTFGMWTRERDGLRYPRLWAFLHQPTARRIDIPDQGPDESTNR